MRSTCSTYGNSSAGKMATFSSKAFEKKLKEMDPSQTSVQTVSLWIIHHRQSIKDILSVWIDQMKKVKPDRKMVLFYLANDVVQNSRKKSKELIQFFGRAFKETLPYLNDKKINGQVERVFKIWEERRVYEKDYLDKFRSLHTNGKQDKSKSSEEKSSKHEKPDKKHEKLDRKVEKSDKKSEKPAEKPMKSKSTSRPLPPDFKMSNVMNMIVNMKELESEIGQQDSQMSTLRVDASDLEAVKQVKDRSGVNKFVKEFEESKEKLDVHCNTMSRCINDKRVLIDMLYHSESYYDAAYEEAKVIVHAYKTFGSRLSSMKRKVESRVKKLEAAWKKKQKEIEEKKASQPEYELEPISDADEPNEFQPIGDLVQSGLESLSRRKKDELYNPADPTLDNVKVLDMDLESDSDQGTPNGPLYDPSSVLYDPGEIEAATQQASANSDSQNQGMAQINIPNPEDVFKMLASQSETTAAPSNQFTGATSLANEMSGRLANEMSTFPQLSGLSAANLQSGISLDGNPKFQLSNSQPVNAQQMTQFQSQTSTTDVVSSSLIATEPSGNLLNNAALSPISDDSCPSPSPEGTPEGLQLDTEASSSATSTNQPGLLSTNTFSSLLPSTPLLTNPAIGNQFMVGDQLMPLAPENWPNLPASLQFPMDTLPNIQAGGGIQVEGFPDWSLPQNLQLPGLPNVSLPSTLGLELPFPISSSTNELSIQNQLFNQTIDANGENMLQPGIAQLPVSQIPSSQLLSAMPEVSTPTQDESPGKAMRPMDILSQLLSKSQQSKEGADEDEETMKRSHSRSSRKHSGKRKHRHHESSHRESSHRESSHRESSHRESSHRESSHRESSHERDSSHSSSSKSKDRSHSSRRRSRSQSKHKEESSHFDSSQEMHREDSVGSLPDSMSMKSPKVPRLNSIDENNCFATDTAEDSSNFVPEHGQESSQINDNRDGSRQLTIFDMRRNNADAGLLKPEDSQSQPAISNQFAKQEPEVLNQAADVNIANASFPEGHNPGLNQFPRQMSLQEAVTNNSAPANISSQGDQVASTASITQDASVYYYNAQKSPATEINMPQFLQNPISQPSPIESTIPLPMFALEFKQELDQGLLPTPINPPNFQQSNFEQQALLPTPTLGDHQVMMQNRPPFQAGGPMQPNMQQENFMPRQEQQMFNPERPQMMGEQNQVFMQGQIEINQERPQLSDSEFHQDVKPPAESSFQRPERPMYRLERPPFHSERPMFRGQRPTLRQQVPHYHEETSFQVSKHENEVQRSPRLQRQRSRDDFHSHGSFEKQATEYESNYQAEVKREFATGRETDSSMHSERGQFVYNNEEGFEQSTGMEEDRAINGIVPGQGHMMSHRSERPGLLGHGYSPRQMLPPRSDQGRNRFRNQGPDSFIRGNRPPHPRMGSPGGFRPRFRPPLRPRLPQGFSPRRPVF